MKQPWTVLIADSDDLSRRNLRRTVDAHEGFALIGEARDGAEAVTLLDRLRPDLALISVDLREIDGLEVLRSLRPRNLPHVILLSEIAGYAVKALEISGVEYLLKPLATDQLSRTLSGAWADLASPAGGDRNRLEQLLATTRSPGWLRCLPIRHNRRIEVLDLEEVDWIGAAGNYVELHAGGQRLLHRITLKELAERVDPAHFARIHRSTIVNVDRVQDLESTPQGDWKLRLVNGDRVRLSRRFREALERIVPERRQSLRQA